MAALYVDFAQLTDRILGHVFPGASMPYGMAKAVADVNDELQGGYSSNDADSKFPTQTDLLSQLTLCASSHWFFPHAR